MEKLNRKGTSLIQVMIGLAISAVLGLSLMTLFADSYKSLAGMSSKIDENILRSDLNRIFSDKDLCAQAIVSPASVFTL